MSKKRVELKRYIVRKYIMGRSIRDALKKDKITFPDDIWVDEDWKKENPNRLESQMGFNHFEDSSSLNWDNISKNEKKI